MVEKLRSSGSDGHSPVWGGMHVTSCKSTHPQHHFSLRTCMSTMEPQSTLRLYDNPCKTLRSNDVQAQSWEIETCINVDNHNIMINIVHVHTIHMHTSISSWNTAAGSKCNRDVRPRALWPGQHWHQLTHSRWRRELCGRWQKRGDWCCKEEKRASSIIDGHNVHIQV